MFQPRFLQTINRVDQHPHDEAHQEFGHQQVDVNSHRSVQQSQHEVELRQAQARFQHTGSHQRRDHHEQRIHDVVGGDDARAMGSLAAALDQGVERHAVEAAEHREQEQIGHYPPMRGVGEKRGRAHQPGRGEAARGPPQIDGEGRHADGAERHQTDFDLVTRQPLAGQRTQSYTDRKRREQQGHDILIAAQAFLGEAGEGGEKHRAEKPQPGNPQQSEKHRAITVRVTQIGERLADRVPVDHQLRRRRW